MRMKKLVEAAHLEVIFDDEYVFGDGRQVALVWRDDLGCLYCPVEYSLDEWRTLTEKCRLAGGVQGLPDMSEARPQYREGDPLVHVWMRPDTTAGLTFTPEEVAAISAALADGKLDLPAEYA